MNSLLKFENKASDLFDKYFAKYFEKVFLICLIALLLSAFMSLGQSFKNYHSWRDSQTYSVAKNFVEEDFNLFKPRLDIRGIGNGVFGMEFPWFNATVALAMKPGGANLFTARFISLLHMLLTFYLLFLIARKKGLDTINSLFLVSIFAANFELQKVQGLLMPEPALLMYSSLCVFLILFRTNVFRVLTLVSFTLAVLIKPSAFCLLPLLVYWGRYGEDKWVVRDWRNWVYVAVFSIVPLSLMFLWKNHAMAIDYYPYDKVIAPRVSEAISHHYHRNWTIIFRELTWTNIYWAIKKWLKVSIGPQVIFFFGLMLVFRKSKFKLLTSDEKFSILASILSLVAFLLFLFLAGNVQMKQTYYALGGLICSLPLVISLLKIIPKYAALAVCIFMTLYFTHKQFVNMPDYFKHNESISKISAFVDRHSSEDSTFLVHGMEADSTNLVRINRKGLVFRACHLVEKWFGHFDFLLIPDNIDKKWNCLRNLDIKATYRGADHVLHKLR